MYLYINFIQISAYRISRSNSSKVVVGNGDLKVEISCQLIMVDVVKHMRLYNVYAQHNFEAHNCSFDNACTTVN